MVGRKQASPVVDSLMSLGVIALLLAGLGAGWLLWRVAQGGAGGGRNVTILKIVIWLGLAAVLFAVRLAPLAVMVLLAAAAVTAIEIWRDNAVAKDASPSVPAPSGKGMSRQEAAAILGVKLDAAPDEIRAAYKNLISQIHPDRGGTDYLAAKINEAREVLLREP